MVIRKMATLLSGDDDEDKEIAEDESVNVAREASPWLDHPCVTRGERSRFR